MALIKDAEGRKDGGYTRLFGNEELGLVISKVQAAVITAGTELEKLIIEACEKRGMLIADLDAFLDAPATAQTRGTRVAPKKVVKKSRYACDKEPDFLVFIHGGGEARECLIVELKDGDNFDTKKASGEVKTLKEFQNHIAAQIPYRTKVYICCYHAPDRGRVVEAFKHVITEEMAMTGREFCYLLSLDYDEILRRRASDQVANMDYFVESISKIEAVIERLRPLLFKP